MPLTEVTDPNKLESVRAAFGQGASSGELKEVADPDKLAAVKSQFETKPSSQSKTQLVSPSEDEEWLPEVLKPVSKGLNFARELLGGETVAKAPSLLLGDQPRTGAQNARELGMERRGMIPEYREVQGNPQGILQGVANTAADAIAMVGSEVTLPLELGVVGARQLGRLAGGLATDIPVAAYRAGFEEPAKALFGDISARALANKQRQGQYQTVKAAKETGEGYAEFVKGAAFGLSPAAFESARTLIDGGGLSDVADAGVEALKAYPLASVMPFWHGAKLAGERGGAPIVREGQPVQTITGKPIVANKFGEALFEPVAAVEKVAQEVAGMPAAQKVASVAQKGAEFVGQQAQKVSKYGTEALDLAERNLRPDQQEQFKAIRETAGDATKAIKPAIENTVKAVMDWGKEEVQPAWQRLTYDAVTPKDVTRQQGLTAANQILMSGESPAARNMKVAVTNHGVLRDLQTELADPRFKGATDLEKFQAIEGTLGDTQKLTEVPVMDQAARAAAQELGDLFVQNGMPLEIAQKAVPYTVLEGVRMTKQGKVADPLAPLHLSLAELKAMDPASAQTRIKAYEAIVTANMKDPNFIAAADQAWAGKGYRWVPGAEVRQRNGYAEAIREVQKEALAQGRPHFDLNVPELGELRKDYTFQLYDKLIDDLNSTPVGRKQLMQLLISSPIARMAANPTSPIHTQALAAWHSQPGGARAKLTERLNEISVEAVKNYGLAPATVLKHYDRWMSRAFTDAINAQIKLSDHIDAMGAELRLPKKVQRQIDSGRFRRKLSEEASNKRFTDMITNGDISLHDALASTVVASMIMANHLHNMAEFHDVWKAQGLLSDSKRPNTVQVAKSLVAPEERAASPDPYNFVYGKLAGKWVDKQVANQLNLVPRAMRTAIETMPYIRALNDLGSEVLGFTRFMKTTGNAIVYPIRNAITDPIIPWAASGESPYTGEGRRLNLEATADVDRMVATRNDPTGMVLSPTLREMLERGVLDPNKVPNDLAIPAHMRPGVNAMVKKMEKMVEEASDPTARVKALTHAFMYAKAMGTAGMVEMPLAGLAAAKDAYKASMLAREGGQTRRLTAARAPSEFIGALNDHLSEIALAQLIGKMETKRAVWAYKVARNKLKLDPDRAAIFVRDTVYGIDKPTELMSRVSQNPLSLIMLPLFSRYGLWQPKRALQRALNDRNLWVNSMLMHGMDAMNEEDLLRDPFLETNHQDRLNRLHVQHVAAGDIGLGSVNGVQEFMRFAGVPEAVVSSVGKPNNLIDQDLTNLIGGQTFIHQYKPEKQNLEAWTQFGVYGGLVSQAMNDQLRNPEFREQTGLRPGETKSLLSTAPRELTKSLVYHTFPSSWLTPSRPEDPSSTPIPIPFIGRAAGVTEKIGRAAIEGRPALKNVYGEKINPIDMASREFGSFAPNIIDGASFQARLAAKLKAQENEVRKKMVENTLTQVPPNLPEEERRRLQEQINLSAGHIASTTEEAYTWPSKKISRDEAIRQQRERAKAYYERMKKLKEGE